MLRHACLDDVQHLERGKSLPGRWELVDVVAVIVGRNRLHPLRLVLGQVVELHDAAERAGFRDDGPGDVALVESVAPFLLQQAERARHVGLSEDAVERRRVAVGQPGGSGISVALERIDGAPPLAVHPLVDGKAFLGVCRGWFEDLGKCHRAEPLQERVPARRRSPERPPS